jgi:hypothetical protein
VNRAYTAPSAADAVRLAVVLVGGVAAGILAKAADRSTVEGVSDLGTYFGVWAVLLVIVSSWGRRADLAVVNAVAFVLAMLLGYYAYTQAIGIYVPPTLVLAWVGVAFVFVPPFAVLVHHARSEGWLAALGVAVPVGILVAEAYSFRLVLPLHQVQFFFDAVAAVALLVVLPRSMLQRARATVLVLPCAIVAARVLDDVWTVAARAM